MKTRAGVWIDHKKAIIVSHTEKGDSTNLIISKVDKQPSRADGVRSTAHYDTHEITPDARIEKRFKAHLNMHYDAVIASLRNAEYILIYGPSEAKTELKKRLAKDKLADRIAGIETADKMTAHQLAARVRKHFGEQTTRKLPGTISRPR